MKKSTFFIAILLFSTLFLGCRKYDEGPKFITFRTVKNRISNGQWNLEKIITNKIDVTNQYNKSAFSYNFNTKSGFASGTIYDQIYTDQSTTPSTRYKLSGYVTFFENDQMEMYLTNYSGYYNNYPPIFSVDSNGETPRWTILKLTNKEFWLITLVDGEYTTMKLTKAN